MNFLRHGSGVSCKIVTATSVLIFAFVMGAPGVLGHSGWVEPSSLPQGYGGRASGAAEVADLTVAGVPIGVTGEPNQVYEILGVFKLIINEQVDSSSGATNAITVNALHAWFSGIEVIVSSASSSITCGGSSGGLLPLGGTVPMTGGLVSTRGGACEQLHDFVTGGGWFDPANSAPGNFQPGRVNFGFNAGPRPGNPEIKGHLNAINHETGQHLQGVNVDSYAVWSNDPVHCRTFTGDALLDGASGRYQAWVCDYSEPGRNDRFAVVAMVGGSTIYWDNYDGSPAPEGGDLDGGNIQLHVF